MKLKLLLEGVVDHSVLDKQDLADLRINNLCLDTRHLVKGDGFVAIPGSITDGRNYIKSSIACGASVVLSEGVKSSVDVLDNVPIISIKNLPVKLGKILNNLYKINESELRKIAITGTNGKTSVANYIAKIFSLNNLKAATIGTLGYGFLEDLKATGLTTPDCVTNYKILATLINNGAKAVTIEASSHALEQHRLANLKFESVVFTNLTQDHLDYHSTLENYWAAKKKLFLDYDFNNAVINIDDPYGLDLYNELTKSNNGNKKQIISYSVKNPKADICVSDINYSFLGTTAKLNVNFGRDYIKYNVSSSEINSKNSGEINSKLIGEFNLSNLLASIAVALAAKISLPDILKTVPLLRPVDGRMMSFGGVNQPLVIVDYAHTPDALYQVLKTLKQLAKASIITVFGCGGDRDKTKRPKMLEASTSFSNKIILTNDNPRSEEPNSIINDILGSDSGYEHEHEHEHEHVHSGVELEVILDRALAIETAILNAKVNDIVLIAGKGHENYQIIGDKRLDFSDSNVVLKVLSLFRGN